MMVSIISAMLLKSPVLAASNPPTTAEFVSPYMDSDGTYHSFNTLDELQQYVQATFPGQPVPIQISWS
jgi:hypothetical protein